MISLLSSTLFTFFTTLLLGRFTGVYKLFVLLQVSGQVAPVERVIISLSLSSLESYVSALSLLVQDYSSDKSMFTKLKPAHSDTACKPKV